jgi:hypothetical protein
VTTTPAPLPPIPVSGPSSTTLAEIQLSGASVGAGGSCSFSVPVLVQSAGTLTVNTGVPTTGPYAQVGNATEASVTVPATASPATVASSFSPGTIDANGTTTWTVSIANPNASTTLTDIRFTTRLMITPSYVFLWPEAITSNSCAGSASITPGGITTPVPNVNYGGGTLAPGATCTITVTITPRGAAFAQLPVPVTVMSNQGGTSAVSTATLTSLAPHPSLPSDAFTHGKPKVAAGGVISEALRLPGEGTVRLRESWRGKLIAHIQKSVTRGRKLTIKLVPRRAVRSSLRSHHGAKLKLSMTYTPAGGKARRITHTVRTPHAGRARDEPPHPRLRHR